jgi:hypothetical protein
MDQMLIGAIAAASLAAGLFFFRFWRSTRDRFFLLFALSFWIEGVNRVMLYELVGLDDDAPVYYLIRLLAYGLILAAIIDKNRGPRRRE